MAVGQMVRDARAGRGPAGARFSACPTCGQHNLKEGQNNLMRCYACTSCWCYTCRAVLRQKPGLHFGPSRCKQHTDT